MCHEAEPRGKNKVSYVRAATHNGVSGFDAFNTYRFGDVALQKFHASSIRRQEGLDTLSSSN